MVPKRGSSRIAWEKGSMALPDNPILSTLGAVVGETPEIQRIHQIIRVAARTSHPILIAGESGTGKEVIARAIHLISTHSKASFRVRSCMTIRSVDLEREWSPGASTARTLFLDDLEYLNVEVQGRLLQIIEKAENIEDCQSKYLVPHLIAATSTDLREAVDAGSFRRDLYFRVTALTLKVPPLRERLADIPLLAGHFLCKRPDTSAKYQLSDAALHSLLAYSWPGNVRELRACLELACESATGGIISVSDLPAEIRGASSSDNASSVVSLSYLDGETPPPGL